MHLKINLLGENGVNCVRDVVPYYYTLNENFVSLPQLFVAS